MSGKQQSPIPAHLQPPSVAHLLAKSEEMGGDTLAEHTWLVLQRLHDLYRLYPHLSAQTGDERLWQRLYYACFLHDFGKAAASFQALLEGRKDDAEEWRDGRHRHEILSLAFIDWLFPSGHPDRIPVIAIIASHHKDALGSTRQDDISFRYGGDTEDEDDAWMRDFLISQIDTPARDALWQWLVDYVEVWREAFDFPVFEGVHPTDREYFGRDALDAALETYYDYCDYLANQADAAEKHRNLLYRGLIFASDHAASAGAGTYPDLLLSLETAFTPVQDFELRTHQTQAQTAPAGSTMMIAPTGSGKTEAALLWAARQHILQSSNRLFYTLPYQASMNAMAERLSQDYFGFDFRSEADESRRVVTIQHSRAVLKFYQDMMAADSGAGDTLKPKQMVALARQRKDRTRLSYYPVQILSPYQILKAGYRLKKYERLLLDYTNALFIFDEIHAYDAKRMALIIEMMRWLRDAFGARFLVMTATLPALVQERLCEALAIDAANILKASPTDYKNSQRHRVVLLEGQMLAQPEHIIADYRAGKSVLVCCNQVKRAQTMMQLLEDAGILADDRMLLHGRFNGKDRSTRETNLAELVGVGAEPRPFVLVATQVVEVSLNIDLDTIYTDPAPLDALVQRFGRVNRKKRHHDLSPVHIFKEPADKDGSRPYHYELVYNSIAVLEKYSNAGDSAIDEAQITQMLNEIYVGTVRETWETLYKRTQTDFLQQIHAVKPYHATPPEVMQLFYKMFDGVQILPESYLDAYQDALEEGGWLAASAYLVNISHGQYRMMQDKGLIRQDDADDYVDVAAVPYTSAQGLQIEAALRMADTDA